MTKLKTTAKPGQRSFFCHQTGPYHLKNNLLLLPLIIAIFTLASSCTSNTPPKKVSFTLRKATLRVDRSYLVSARQIAIIGTVSGESLTGLSLRFAVDRKALLKLRPPHFDLEISNVKMLELNPDLPVYIEVRLKSSVLPRAEKLYKRRKNSGMPSWQRIHTDIPPC